MFFVEACGSHPNFSEFASHQLTEMEASEVTFFYIHLGHILPISVVLYFLDIVFV